MLETAGIGGAGHPDVARRLRQHLAERGAARRGVRWDQAAGRQHPPGPPVPALHAARVLAPPGQPLADRPFVPGGDPADVERRQRHLRPGPRMAVVVPGPGGLRAGTAEHPDVAAPERLAGDRECLARPGPDDAPGLAVEARRRRRVPADERPDVARRRSGQAGDLAKADIADGGRQAGPAPGPPVPVLQERAGARDVDQPARPRVRRADGRHRGQRVVLAVVIDLRDTPARQPWRLCRARGPRIMRRTGRLRRLGGGRNQSNGQCGNSAIPLYCAVPSAAP